MPFDPYIFSLIIIILGAIVLYATEIIPADATSILIMVILMLTGLLSIEDGFSGFSNRATLTVLALLVISAGLQNTGVVNVLGEKVEEVFPASEWKAILVIMLMGAFFSAFIATTAVVAVLLPLVLRVSRSSGINPSKLLMPLSFAAIIGGSSTIIGTSTNLLVSSISAERGLGSFSIFEFTHIGLVFFAALLVYMVIFGRKIIPTRRSYTELTDSYSLKEYLTEIIIKENSPFIGKAVKDLSVLHKVNVEVIEIRRMNEILFSDDVMALQAGDKLVIKGRVNDIISVTKIDGIAVIRDRTFDDKELAGGNLVLLEVIVGPNSKLQNKYFDPDKFQRKFKAMPLAIRTSGVLRRTRLTEVKLKVGSAFLIEAKKNNLQTIYESNDLMVLQEHDPLPFKKDKMPIALITTIAMVFLAAFKIVPIPVAAWMGAVTMFITGCISMQRAYENVQWKVIFLLAGVIPLGKAIEQYGLDVEIANFMVMLIENTSTYLIVAILFFFTTGLTAIISNNATAILFAPIAISMAAKLGMDPKPLLVTIMFAANASFFTPIGYQTNTLIYGAGNYKFRDFFKVGGIYTLIIWVLASLLIPFFLL